MKHLLIVRFSALGDVAMTVPVIASLACTYPDLHITVLSRDFMRPLFKGLPANVHFMGADLKQEYKGLKGLGVLYRRLAAKQFTAVADFHDVLRTKYLRLRFKLSGVPVASIDKDRAARAKLVDQQHKVLLPQKSVFNKYIQVLTQLGYPVEPDFKSLFGTEKGDLKSIPLWNEEKADRYWVGIAPFAAHAGKIYPLDKMEKVAIGLSKQKNTQVFLFGAGEYEGKILKEWEQAHPLLRSMANTLTMYEELVFMSHLDVMVSMDSANMHLASLVAVPVVSIWGATHPYAGFMGWNQSQQNAVQLDLPCRPCSIFGNKPCYREDYACLNKIIPEQIVEKVNQIRHRIIKLQNENNPES